MSDEREPTGPVDGDGDPVDAPTATASTSTESTATESTATESTASTSTATGKASSKRTLRARLYHGETNVDFVGRRRLWFAVSGIAVLLAVGGLVVRGFNLGIDFEGGVVWEVPAGEASVEDAEGTIADFGLSDPTVQELESDQGREIRVEAEPISPEESDEVSAALAELTGADIDDVDLTSVGPSWGDEVSSKALRALVVFLVVVTIYIALRFELKMALATLAALVHDVLITAGVYALTQLEVTPATVIAILTILGYSIYDGIVVFDKVDENTRRVSSTGGLSYGGMVNLSLNQALMRSLNTTITALLPVGSLLVVGSWIMGASTLEEFAVALLIGLFSGAYSSIFIASPLLALLKEREPRYRDIAKRVADRGGDREVVAALIAGESPRVAQARTPAKPRPGKARAKATTGASGTAAATDVVDEADEEDDAEDAAPAIVAPSGRVIPPRPRKKSSKGNKR